jgi:hypothetical protein
VAKLYIRIDDGLFERLELRALGAGLSISELVRPLLVDAAGPGGSYVDTANDEILAILVEVYALIITGLADQHPGTLKRGAIHARQILQERGLLSPQLAPADAAIDTSHRGGAR